ncbi:MAG: hypothetical protein JEY94_11150 [Melioribacteraceae bacterium]|nr:hypothetical protein [Melioribacteraceae bacterium]
MKKSLLVILFSLLVSVSLLAQNNLLVDLGFDKIYSDEFIERFEMNPIIKGNKNLDSLKKEFLYTLIAEKLWSKESADKGLLNSDYVKYSLESMEKLFVKDALYNLEINAKVRITSELLNEGINRSALELRVKYIYANDEIEIKNIYDEILKFSSKDSITFIEKKYLSQIESIPVVFGQMEKQYEDLLFSMNPKEFSKPQLTKQGWIIFYIANKIERILPKPSEFEEIHKNVKTIIEDRQIAKLQSDFYDKYIKGNEVKAEIKLYKPLLNEIIKIAAEKKSLENLSDSSNIILDFNQILKIENSFSPSELDEIFIKFNTNPIKLKSFLRELSFWGLEVPFPYDEESCLKCLSSFTREFIQSEIIAQIGYKRNLQQTSSVGKSLKMWHDSYSSKYYMHKFVDSAKVSDETARRLLANNNPENNFTTEFVEIYNKQLNSISLVLDELDKGIQFEALANKFNERDSKFDKNIFTSDNNEYLRIIDNLKPGEIYGPIPNNGGYSVIKCKENTSEAELVADDSRLKDFKQKVFMRNLDKLYNSKTLKFAEGYDIKINYSGLEKVNVSKLNVFVHRQIGFGGRISAVPVLTPLYKWFKDYKKQKELKL